MSEQVRRKLKVAMQENARLKVEVESYRAAVMVGVTESNRLKAEVERLKNNVAYLDRTLDDYIDKSMKRVNDERDEVRIGNALMHERLEAMKRLNAIQRLKGNQEPGPLTDASD